MAEEFKHFNNRIVFKKAMRSNTDYTWTFFTQLKNDYRHCRLLVNSPEFDTLNRTDRISAIALYNYTKETLRRFYKHYRSLLDLERALNDK